MNSEELELSLRTEFEGYLKNVRGEIRRDAEEFQRRVEDEFAQQKAKFDAAFREFAAKYESDPEFDEPFRASVAEHIRLARDEGARITADAMVEAERLEVPVAAPKYDLIKEAVDDISGRDSQSAILKSLVQHAGKFAPRGAFFIIKNEHFGGWKVFDSEGETANAAIRDIHFPVSADSILGTAANSLSATAGSASNHSSNSAFLSPLGFDEPERIYAIPLVARGRAVAVMYADHGADGNGEVNREALETIVRVAGLTVELLAFSSQAPKTDEGSEVASHFTEDRQPAGFGTPPPPSFESPAYAAEPAAEQPETFSFGGPQAPTHEALQESPPRSPFAMPPVAETPVAEEYETESYFDTTPYVSSDTQGTAENLVADSPFVTIPSFEATSFDAKPARQEDSTGGQMAFDSGGSIERASLGGSPFETQAAEYEPAPAFGNAGFGQAPEPAAQPVASSPLPVSQARRADRPVDLPIEVPDEERRIHNDARRFARLLVSEIKLYNEKKVTEGRESQDLYDRLREAIDRSREMYDKRVQPPVAAKFDYFHYELVNSLADGDSARLGSGYPGSRV